MAIKTFYFLDDWRSGSGQHLVLQDGGTAPNSQRINTGWIVGTDAPTRYALMEGGFERASSVQITTPLPTEKPNSALGDCYRSENTYTGAFAAGDWTLAMRVQGETEALGNQDGKLRFRVWRAPTVTGATATEITTAALVTNGYTNLTNAITQSLSVTWAAPAFSLFNEYLFVQVAHQLDGAGALASADTHLCRGPDDIVTTTDFTVADTTLPTLTWAVNGATLTGTASEALNENYVPTPNRFDVRVNGSPRAVSSVAVSGTTVTLTLSSPVNSTDTVTISG